MSTQQKVIQRQRTRRTYRVRNSVRRHDRPRLSVFRTSKHFYCQIIDDARGRTLASASTAESEIRGDDAKTGTCDAAMAVGKLLASRALAAGIKKVCLDRGRFRYHGRIAAMANAAREAGLEF